MATTPRGLPSWDLSDLYRSPADRKIEQTLNACKRRAAAFQRRYRGRIERLSKSPREVQQLLVAYENILQEASKPICYAQLKFSESSKDAAVGAFLQRMRAEYTAISQELLFVELELALLPLAVLKRLARAVKPYTHFLQLVVQSKPHRLSEPEERLMNDKSLTGRGALVRLFDEELSLKQFTVVRGKRSTVLSEAKVLSLLYSANRDERQAAAVSLTKGLTEEARRLTFVFNTVAEDKAIDDRYRKFKNPEDSRHLANEIEPKVVHTMADAVADAYGTMQEFYRFKAKLLGHSLCDYDRYAPVGRSRVTYSYGESKRLILRSFEEFSPEFAAVTRMFFDCGWVDVADRPGKRGGAFCSFVTPDLHPYVFMNFSGSLRDVFTLAHELGHALHACFMREQSYLNFEVPLTVAETASVFAEMLLFDHLKQQKLSRQERLSLYVGKIESIFATVFRQVAMYRFEQDFHAARRVKGELSTAEIGQLWRHRQGESFGSSVTLTPNYDCWWSYIGHFIHTPFYVYAYAFGELLTLSLYATYKRDGAPFVAKYRELLRSGGCKDPAALLKPFGVDLTKRSFWERGLKMIQEMVDEVQTLA